MKCGQKYKPSQCTLEKDQDIYRFVGIFLQNILYIILKLIAHYFMLEKNILQEMLNFSSLWICNWLRDNKVPVIVCDVQQKYYAL